jgi:hypothetical protein
VKLKGKVYKEALSLTTGKPGFSFQKVEESVAEEGW